MNVTIVVCATVLAVAVLVFVWWRERQRLDSLKASAVPELPPATGIKRLWRETIVVTMKKGEAFQGVLWEQTDTEIVLRNSFGLGMAEKGQNLPVDGELLIFISDIAYVQKP